MGLKRQGETGEVVVAPIPVLKHGSKTAAPRKPHEWGSGGNDPVIVPTHRLFVVFLKRLRLRTGIFLIFVDRLEAGDRIAFQQPTIQIDLSAAGAAERKGAIADRIGRRFADGAARYAGHKAALIQPSEPFEELPFEPESLLEEPEELEELELSLLLLFESLDELPSALGLSASALAL